MQQPFTEPKRLRIVLTLGKEEVVSNTVSEEYALYEAINLLCMQTGLKAGFKLTVVEDK